MTPKLLPRTAWWTGRRLEPTTIFGPVNIVIGKIEWDADVGGEDIVSVARFLETDRLDEVEFDSLITASPNLSTANWTANKPDFDQSQFDTLSIAGLKFFVDEVRIGTTFRDIIKGGVRPEIPPPLIVETNGADLDISWGSRAGMFYVLRSNVDLEPVLSTWESVNVPGSVEVDGVFQIATAPPLNMHTIARPTDATTFYRVEEFRLPPVVLLDEDFDEVAGGTLPAGWTTGFELSDVLMNTDWELGGPVWRRCP